MRPLALLAALLPTRLAHPAEADLGENAAVAERNEQQADHAAQKDVVDDQEHFGIPDRTFCSPSFIAVYE